MKINLDKKQIRTFGLGLAAFLIVISFWKFYKGQASFSIALLTSGLMSAFSALFFQPLIKPVYIVMMKIAHVLGWINTRILLGLIFYIMITPVGLIMRVFGKDILDEKIKYDKDSYWVKKEKMKFEKSNYERQY